MIGFAQNFIKSKEQGWEGKTPRLELSLVRDCVQTAGPRAHLPLHPLPRVALAEQEASGERVNINWEGLWQNESRFPGADGLCHEADGSHPLQAQTQQKEA